MEERIATFSPALLIATLRVDPEGAGPPAKSLGIRHGKGIRDGRAYRGFPHYSAFCTLRVILKRRRGEEVAMGERIAASSPASDCHASRGS
jgi:hypothetical protein